MSYQVRDYTLPPGQTVTINIVGSECAVYEATKDFLLSHDALDPQFITGGMKLKPKNGFESIVMLNPHDEPVTVKLGITDGQIEDSRLSTSAPVQVSEIQTTVRVADPYNGSSFSGVITQLGYVSGAIKGIGRGLSEQFDVGEYYPNWTPKHKIGTSHMAVIGVGSVPVSVVDPASNTNGVIIRTISTNNANGYACSIYVGSQAPSSWQDATKRQIFNFYSNNTLSYFYHDPVFLPAGEGVYFVGSGGGAGSLHITWDYL
tara:strand:+ start:7004 stop:7783 length:780 start_codon:yes stop_codon:yes gene_type:complete